MSVQDPFKSKMSAIELQRALMVNIAQLHETIELIEKNDPDEIKFWNGYIKKWGKQKNLFTLEDVKNDIKVRINELHKQLM